VVIFSLLVALLVLWRGRAGSRARGSPRWWVALAILGLFAVWANLHGGFIAGLLLLGLVTVGLAIDHWRGIPGALPLSRIAALGLVGILAAVIVTVSTPLGAAIWSYLLSFQNQAISLASTEWESAFGDPLAVLYLVLAALRGLDVGALPTAPPGHDAAGDRRFLGLRRLLDPQHRLHRARPRAAGRLDGAESQLGPMRHLRTQVYRPRTNGKAERFIKTLTDRWAYDAVYGSSSERAAALPAWLDDYNRRRPHRSLGRMPPMQRLLELQVNNVVEAHT
jgi:Integrase core domain